MRGHKFNKDWSQNLPFYVQRIYTIIKRWNFNKTFRNTLLWKCLLKSYLLCHYTFSRGNFSQQKSEKMGAFCCRSKVGIESKTKVLLASHCSYQRSFTGRLQKELKSLELYSVTLILIFAKDHVFTELSRCFDVEMATCIPPYKVKLDIDILGYFANNWR